jgi:hypothetical protein
MPQTKAPLAYRTRREKNITVFGFIYLNKSHLCCCFVLDIYSRLSIIRAWFNRFAAQPRQCIFKETILFSVSITLFKCFVCQSMLAYYNLESTVCMCVFQCINVSV